MEAQRCLRGTALSILTSSMDEVGGRHHFTPGKRTGTHWGKCISPPWFAARSDLLHRLRWPGHGLKTNDGNSETRRYRGTNQCQEGEQFCKCLRDTALGTADKSCQNECACSCRLCWMGVWRDVRSNDKYNMADTGVLLVTGAQWASSLVAALTARVTVERSDLNWRLETRLTKRHYTAGEWK
jgi:hypothetical protein